MSRSTKTTQGSQNPDHIFFYITHTHRTTTPTSSNSKTLISKTQKNINKRRRKILIGAQFNCPRTLAR